VIASQELSAPDPAIALHRLPGVGHMPQVEAPGADRTPAQPDGAQRRV